MESKDTLGLETFDNEEPVITKEYSVDIETYKCGFAIFQNMFAKKRNIIFTVLLLLVSAYNVYLITAYPDYIFTCVLIILICLSLVFIIWNNARLLKKNFGRSLDDIKGDLEKDKYELKIFDTYLKLASEIYVSDEDKKALREQMETDEAYEKELESYIHPPVTVMNLKTDNVKIIENENLFLLYEKKTVFYVIPKSILSEEECNKTREIFKNNLEGLFKDISKSK